MNYLEQLVSEWYQYQGYWVKANVRIERKEIDVLAFSPIEKKLVHLEASTDPPFHKSNTDKNYLKKFRIKQEQVAGLFCGCKLPDSREKLAIFMSVQKENLGKRIGGGRIVHISELLQDINEGLKGKKITNGIVPKNYPILRTLQIVIEHRETLFGN